MCGADNSQVFHLYLFQFVVGSIGVLLLCKS
jgi:hypothetical protein